MDGHHCRVEWRSALEEHGALSVMTCGMTEMLLSCVPSWDSQDLVSSKAPLSTQA